ncbi:M56 family metallopeptidase [Gorillibacterium timonense]|uniref:M56 family metallopeptidase n=1 Tax=Gorillibacterium timonense TaxID=1689269 RepID=UPI00071CB293|nr:M56 family metallopeptidase [Gorillibacterium timonense]
MALLTTLISCSITMSLMTLGYMALMPLLSRRYAAKWTYRIWLVIVLGWVIPFRPLIELPFLQPAQAVQESIMAPFSLPQASIGPPASGPLIVNERVEGSAGSVSSVGSAVSTAFPLWPWLSAIWAAGFAIVIVVPLWKHRRYVRFVDRWSERVDDEAVIQLVNRLKAELGINAIVELKRCPGIRSPMLIGFIRPLILLPPIKISVHELELILKHELIHFKRHDIWNKALVLLASGLHWFNPVVYLMRRAVAVQCEISCDAFVLAGADSTRRQQYGETILDVIRNGENLQTDLSTAFMGGKKGLKKRLLSIVDTKPKKAGLALLGLFLLVIVITGGAWATTDKEEEKHPAPTPSALYGMDAKYRKLLDLRFDHYEEMTVSEYRNKAWEAIGQDEAAYRELLNGIPESWFKERQANRDIQFVLTIMNPILSDKWRSWSFGGTKEWNSGMLEYGASYTILDADTLKMKDRNRAVEGLQAEVARFVESKSEDELADEAAMQALLQEEGRTWEQKYSTPSLEVTISIFSFRAEPEKEPLPSPAKDSIKEAESALGEATADDYARYLSLQAKGYKSLSVAEFNRSVLVTMEDGGPFPQESWERISHRLRLQMGDIPETLTEEEYQFLAITLNASLSENSAKHMQEYSNAKVLPYLKDRIKREPITTANGQQNPSFQADMEYTLTYTIPNEGTLTVSERDYALMGLLSGVRAFVDQWSEDEWVTGRPALESEIDKLEKQYSSTRVQLSVENLIYQIYDERKTEIL